MKNETNDDKEGMRMPTWNSRGLRGSVLEEMINYTNEQYLMKKLALIQKIPTPIKPIQIEKETRHITLAYFDQKSTVDYIGAVQGVSAFPLQNIHQHQIQFMKNFEQQEGIAFIILYYSHLHEAYYIPFRDIIFFWERAEKGGRKSFTYEEVDKTYRIAIEGGIYIRYLETLQLDLLSRES